MKRLTKRNEQDTGYYYPHCFKKCDGLGASSECEECDFMDKVSEKLGQLEDLEEQGKLLELPCTVGDKIFVIPSQVNYRLNIVNKYEENNRVYEQIVDHIEIYKGGYLLSTCKGMRSVLKEFYKETWFLTREEAEAALKERGRG